MATRGRLSSFSGLTGSKLVLSVVVVVLVAGLFLVPEILELQKKGGSSATKSAVVTTDDDALNDIFGAEEAAIAPVTEAASSQESSFSKLLSGFRGNSRRDPGQQRIALDGNHAAGAFAGGNDQFRDHGRIA